MNTACLRPRALPLALACASLLAAAQAARAADTVTRNGTTELEEIVVTGFRMSLESSIEFKKESLGIVESVSAEEIGKLPDVSIADALARLPGLAAQRVDGRAQVIALRGMAPKYAVTLLNGREMVSTGDNRSVEYDQFPSELIATAKVYKTQDAALMSQGLSGTVDLASVRPLDFTSRVSTVSVRAEKNSNGELNDGTRDLGGRLSGSYIDQFADGTLGVAIGYAHLDNPGQEKYYKSWWWADTSAWDASLEGVPAGVIALQGFEAGVTSTERKRDGLMGVIEYKPGERLHSILDLYYSRFEQVSVQSEMQASITSWDGAVYTNPTYTTWRGDTFLTGGEVAINPVVLNRYNDREDEIFAGGWRTDFSLDERWTLIADLSYSQARRDEQTAELTALANTPSGFAATDVNLTDGGVSHYTPLLDYTDPALVSLAHQWDRGGRTSLPKVDDQMHALQLSATRAFEGWLSGVDFGASYSERSKDMDRREVYYYLADGTPVTLAAGDLEAPSSLSFAGIPGVIHFDFNRVLREYYTAGVPAALDQQPGRSWSVEEKVARGYGRLDFHWVDAGGFERLKGNLGVQYVYTDQSSDGIVWAGTALSPITDGATYDDVLPSLNASWFFSDSTIARFGAAKEMARPNMEDMRAGFTAAVSADPPYLWSAGGGNATLEPWRADAFDLSLEHYFGRSSYVAAAAFYKKLDSFVYTQTIDYDFSGYPNPGPNAPDSDIGQLSRLANGHGGNVKGIELSGVIDGGHFTAALEGIGAVLSYSHTTSDLHEENNPANSLEGLSGDVASAVLYYERHGVSLRVSDRYRSEFESTVRNQFGDNQGSAISGENLVDAQAGYSFEAGPLAGLSVLLQVLNVTDEPYRTSVGVATGTSNPNTLMPERYNTYGRQYLLGATFKF
jgi:iron complex outermembrane receptor protein